MNKLIKLITLGTFVFLFGCTTYIQIVDIGANGNIKEVDDYYVYENDQIKVTYSFLANKGILSFKIYNKLDIPVYIDWKKSSFIDLSEETNKLDYWQDKSSFLLPDGYMRYLFSKQSVTPWFVDNGYKDDIVFSSGNVADNERITFIPPKSGYYRSQFYLLPFTYYVLSVDADNKEVPREDKPDKKTIVYEKSFTKENTPLQFRNFITYSLTEEFTKEYYIDNKFYVTRVQEMDIRRFRGKAKEYDNNKSVYEYPFKKSTSFYINVPDDKSVEYRKNY